MTKTRSWSGVQFRRTPLGDALYKLWRAWCQDNHDKCVEHSLRAAYDLGAYPYKAPVPVILGHLKTCALVLTRSVENVWGCMDPESVDEDKDAFQRALKAASTLEQQLPVQTKAVFTVTAGRAR